MSEKYPGWGNLIEGNVTDDAEVEVPKVERLRESWRSLGAKVLKLLSSRRKKNTETTVAENAGIVTEDEVDYAWVNPVPGDRQADGVIGEAVSEESGGEKMREPRTAEEWDLVREMDIYRRYQRQSAIKGERAQEWAEKLYNKTLTTLEDLEMAVESGDEGVSKRVEQYGDKDIEIYDLDGLPFKTLQHVVDYKSIEGREGYEMAQKAIANPALWARNEAKIGDNGKASGEESDTLSVSYVDADVNVEKGAVKSRRGVTYGFSRLRPDSVIGIYAGDGATLGNVGKMRPGSDNIWLTPEDLAKHSTSGYNEILLRRYDEVGEPMKPDFLIVHDGRITEDTKRHAAYFGVPIVNVEEKSYAEKQRKELVGKIESLNEESSYDEIAKVFQGLKQSSLQIDKVWKEDFYGDKMDLLYYKMSQSLPNSAITKVEDFVERIEPAKRLTLLSGELERVTEEAAEAKAAGEWYTKSPFYVTRLTRAKRDAVASSGLKDAVDSLYIDYRYKMDNGESVRIRTVMDGTDTPYEYFSDLIDKYEESGGTVHDDRIRRGED